MNYFWSKKESIFSHLLVNHQHLSVIQYSIYHLSYSLSIAAYTIFSGAEYFSAMISYGAGQIFDISRGKLLDFEWNSLQAARTSMVFMSDLFIFALKEYWTGSWLIFTFSLSAYWWTVRWLDKSQNVELWHGNWIDWGLWIQFTFPWGSWETIQHCWVFWFFSLSCLLSRFLNLRFLLSCWCIHQTMFSLDCIFRWWGLLLLLT